MKFSISLVVVLLCFCWIETSHAAAFDRRLVRDASSKLELYEQNEDVFKIVKECGADKVLSHPEVFNDTETREESIRNAKCVISCMLKKINLVTDNNELNKDAVGRIGFNNTGTESSIYTCTDEEFYDKCSHIKDEDECEYASKVASCYKSVCKANNKPK